MTKRLVWQARPFASYSALMKRNPLYQEIVAALSKSLDGDLFEACASSLLRDVYPGLVPVTGGKDSGFDGMIADLQTSSFGLVTTTQQDAAGNLKKNLESQRSSGFVGDRVVFATSRKLSPTLQGKLREYAQALGYSKIQIHDQSYFADRLFEHPVWCNELLGITGAPAALALSPVTRRVLRQDTLIGRDLDLKWVRESPGDRLIVGHSGSGKTSLLHRLALSGLGLFLVDDNRTEIANSLRKEQPPVIFIDDAHVDVTRVERLRQLRDELEATFDIIATCWPGNEEKLMHAMTLARSQVRELPPLSLDELVEVVYAVGVSEPGALVHEIAVQASGRPGLAVTLADLCLRGDTRDVVLGDAISRNARQMFAPNTRGEDAYLVAAFGLGGERGMSQQAISDALHIPPMELAARVTSLSFAGVLSPALHRSSHEGFIVVQPPALRAALVRDAFFRGPGTIDIRLVARSTPDPDELAKTLIYAQRSGAQMPRETLISYVATPTTSDETWNEFAYLEPWTAGWVLHNRPDLTYTIARPALHHVPRLAIPALLNLAEAEEQSDEGNGDDPFRRIEEWIHTLDDRAPDGGSSIHQRRHLLASASVWLRNRPASQLGVKALMLCLDPSINARARSPGSGMVITQYNGLVSDNDLEAMADFWPQIRGLLAIHAQGNWSDVLAGIAHWAIPPRFEQSPLSDHTREFMRSYATTMLRDIIGLPIAHRGVRMAAHSLAQRAKLDVDIELDSAISALFVEYHYKGKAGWERANREAWENLEPLVARWSSQSPEHVAHELLAIKRDAMSAGLPYPGRCVMAVQALAGRVQACTPWLSAFLEAGLDAELIEPFLQFTMIRSESGWDTIIRHTFRRPEFLNAGIQVALTVSNPPPDILADALKHVSDHVQAVAKCTRSGLVPIPTLVQLLNHGSDAVAGEAAYGEWLSDPGRSVCPEIQTEWRNAALRSPESYHIAAYLDSEQGFAYDWLQRRIRNKEPLWPSKGNTISRALGKLTSHERRLLLMELSEETADLGFVALLVGDDATLYADLLKRGTLDAVHLAPLSGEPSDSWIEKANVALQHGIREEEIAAMAFTEHGMTILHDASIHVARINRLEQLRSGQPPDVSQILMIAIENERQRVEWQRARKPLHGH